MIHLKMESHYHCELEGSWYILGQRQWFGTHDGAGG